MYLTEVDLRDRWSSNAFLHGLFGIDQVDNRLESNELIDLLQNELRCLSTTDIPHSDDLRVWAFATADLFVLEANGLICLPVLLLED